MSTDKPKCKDCRAPVGWSILEGECPRMMQNFQNAACQGRQLENLHSDLAALLLEVEAWRALAEYISDKGGCIDALRGADGCDLFIGVNADEPSGFEGTSCEKEHFGICAVDIARKLGLVPAGTALTIADVDRRIADLAHAASEACGKVSAHGWALAKLAEIAKAGKA